MMQRTKLKKFLSLILCIVLIAAMALITTGCNDNKQNAGVSTGEKTAKKAQVLGEGKNEFSLTVVDADGEETYFTIHTNKAIVGEALQELDLLSGEEGDYGLYVKTVNGITLDYDKDGMYWAFYIRDEYATSGVDVTAIIPGESYSFKVEK